MSVIQTVQQGSIHKSKQQEGTQLTASLTGESVVCISHCIVSFFPCFVLILQKREAYHASIRMPIALKGEQNGIQEGKEAVCLAGQVSLLI